MGNPDEEMFRWMSVEQTWTRSARIYNDNKDSYNQIMFGVLLFAVPIVLLLQWVFADLFERDEMIHPLFEAVFFLITVLLAQGPCILLTVQICAHQRTQVLECANAITTERFQSLIGVSVLAIVGISLGSILLYIPGVVLSVWWFVLPCVVLLGKEQKGPLYTFMESTNLINSTRSRRGGRWTVFCLIFVLSLFEVIPMVIVTIASEIMTELTQGHPILGYQFIARSVGLVVFLVPSIVWKVFVVPRVVIVQTLVYLGTVENLTLADLRERFPTLFHNQDVEEQAVLLVGQVKNPEA